LKRIYKYDIINITNHNTAQRINAKEVFSMAQQTKMEQSEQFSKSDEILAILFIGTLYTGLMLMLYEVINFLFVNVFFADNQVHGKDKDTLYHLFDTAHLVQHTHQY
jgi:hypothetical protein